MAVWSIVKVSDLEGKKRLDSEYYRPEYLQFKHLLAKHPPLGDCVEKIIHPVEVKRVYADEGLQILLAQNIQHNFLEFGVVVFMPESIQSLIMRNKLFPNDVVMTRSGANYGDAAPYFGKPAALFACADDLVIRPKPDLSAGYLSTFLNTDAGRALIKRGGYGAGQPHIAPPFLKTLSVPRASNDMEHHIDSTVRSAGEQSDRAESLYLQAEQLLLEEARWNTIDLSQSTAWKVLSSRTKEANRLDAEHFQAKYELLIEHLAKTGKADLLGNRVKQPLRRGLQPTYVEDGEVIVVNSQHLGRYFLNIDATERTDEIFWKNNKRCQLQKHDVLLYSTGAYIGRTNAWFEDQQAITNNHVTIIRPNATCNPIYLAVYLNSPLGLLQAERWASGSGQREIYPIDIARFVVYLPFKESQQRIADLVTQSWEARQKARQLLEEAKNEVENLIEGKA